MTEPNDKLYHSDTGDRKLEGREVLDLVRDTAIENAKAIVEHEPSSVTYRRIIQTSSGIVFDIGFHDSVDELNDRSDVEAKLEVYSNPAAATEVDGRPIMTIRFSKETEHGPAGPPHASYRMVAQPKQPDLRILLDAVRLESDNDALESLEFIDGRSTYDDDDIADMIARWKTVAMADPSQITRSYTHSHDERGRAFDLIEYFDNQGSEPNRVRIMEVRGSDHAYYGLGRDVTCEIVAGFNKTVSERTNDVQDAHHVFNLLLALKRELGID